MRLDDVGVDVQALQKLLGIVSDGYFGPVTEQAVRDFQLKHNLVPDGIAGRKTLAALRTGTGNPKELTMSDINQAAERLGVSPRIIMAVNQVESRGNGFLSDGRIVILYERHIMYRQLAEKELNANYYMVNHPNLVNQKRGGYYGGTTEHYRLNSAKMIDETSALESCSYGLFQIMGFHWELLGFESAQAMVAYMEASEGNQLDVFVRFVLADESMHKALKAKKWAEFSKRYNGSAYKSNLHDVKLAQAYSRYAA